MSNNSNISAFLASLSCYVVYFLMFHLDDGYLQSIYSTYNISNYESDMIIFYELIGGVGGALSMLILSRFFSLRALSIIGTFVYVITCIILRFTVIDSHTNYYYFSVYIASYLLGSVSLLLHIFYRTNFGHIISVVGIAYSFIISLMIYELFSIFVNWDSVSLTTLVVSDAALIACFIFLVKKYDVFSDHIDFLEYNFITIINNINLEVVIGYCLSYITAFIINGYSIYFIDRGFFIVFENSVIFHVILLAGFAAISTAFWSEKIKIYRLNFYILLTILLAQLTINYWLAKFNLAFAIWVIQFYLIILLLILNLILIADKFEGQYKLISVMIYLCYLASGFMSGYVMSRGNELELVIENTFLPMCLVILITFAYYAYNYWKKKLFKF
jgi:hypothetical protein